MGPDSVAKRPQAWPKNESYEAERIHQRESSQLFIFLSNIFAVERSI